MRHRLLHPCAVLVTFCALASCSSSTAGNAAGNTDGASSDAASSGGPGGSSSSGGSSGASSSGASSGPSSSGGLEPGGDSGPGTGAPDATADASNQLDGGPTPPPGQTTAIAVSVGSAACAITAGGGVECWGDNSSDELGNGGAPNGSLSPVQVTGLTSGVTAISSGESASVCALTTNGAVQCWGHDEGATPTTVVPSGAVAVSVGVLSACALMSGGTVECWGDNSEGELGSVFDGGASSAPVTVSGLSGVRAISVGGDVTSAGSSVAGTACAILASGGVDCWGSNAYGLLGNGSNAYWSSQPVPVTGLSGGVTAISVGADFACAVTASGGVMCWGDDTWGELGNSSTSTCNAGTSAAAPCSLVPVAVTALPSGVTSVSAGGQFACATTTSGAVECWGSNDLDTLGYSNRDAAAGGPAIVTGLASGVTAVSAGVEDACALITGGIVKCWGFYPTSPNPTVNIAPVEVMGL
jgi:alpha-tubulin suppressor-like RCC1 family protein